MSVALFHLVLASFSLLAVAAATAIAMARWRTRFSASYRLVIAVLAGTLALAAAQVALERSELELDAPLAALLGRMGRVVPPSALDRGGLEEAHLDLARREPELRRATPGAGHLENALLGRAAAPGSPLPRPGDAEGMTAVLTVCGWAAGLVFFLGRTSRRLCAARELLVHSRTAVEGELERAWREIARAWPGARGVELRVSEELEAPACFGFFRRAILLPLHAQRTLEPACLRQVLLHELIHLERRDAWSMCLAELVRALFWFHPAAWWLRRKAEELRELSCDALVVQRAGRPRTYARGLLACAEQLRRPHDRSLTAALPSWSGSRSQFSRRIEMLLQPSSPPRSVPWPTKALICAGFAVCGSAQLALAASAPQERQPEPRKESRIAPVAPEPSGTEAEAWEPEPRAQDWPAATAPPRMAPRQYDPDPTAPEWPPDRIGRATELLERALARNPRDEDLREALELLRQAREPRYTYGYTPRQRLEVEAWREAQRYGSARSEPEADRYSLPFDTGEPQQMENLRDFIYRSRQWGEPPADEPRGSGIETELDETLRLLEERRVELDGLRARIEDLRARARSIDTAPRTQPGSAR